MKRLLSLLLAGVVTSTAATGRAAVIYSGLQDIPISTTFDGVYLNIDTGATGTSPFSGWDINPFFGGVGIGGSAAFQPVRIGTNNSDTIVRMDLYELIDGSLFYSSGETGSSDLLGAPGNFQDGVEGCLGFRFTKDDTSGRYYGWMRMTLTANTSGAYIHDWAWEDSGSGIFAGSTTGAIPEPGRAMLALLGLTGMLLRRRRHP